MVHRTKSGGRRTDRQPTQPRQGRTASRSDGRVHPVAKAATDQLLVSWALRALVAERQAQRQHAGGQR